MSYKPLSRNEIAQRVARDITEGMVVNLGIGMPTLAGNHIPPEREVLLHSENGIIGMGPAPAAGEEDYDLINASKHPVTLLPGAALMHHADSFALMRSGHLDVAVLGAYQVSADGDLANWSTGEDAIPAVGGAMDLAAGARQTWVTMALLTTDGKSKIVPRCSYPLTGVKCVTRIYTDHGTFACSPEGVRVIDLVEGLSLEKAQELIGLPLAAAAPAATA